MTEEKKFVGAKITEEKWLELKRYALENDLKLNQALDRAITLMITKPVKTKSKKSTKGDKK
jgi:hypothetical protein